MRRPARVLSGCSPRPARPADTCQVVLEESDAFTADNPVQTVVRGEDVTFTLHPAQGCTLTGSDYPAAPVHPRRMAVAGFFLTGAAALAWLSLLAAGAGNAFIYFQF